MSSSGSKRSNLEKYILKFGISFGTVKSPAVFTVATTMEKILHLGGLHVTEVPMFAPIMIGIAM
jgi:hypothetical protein